MKNYRTVLNSACVEFVEKKSRFICRVKPVSSEPEALDFIKEISDIHRDATHNVFAYIISGDVEVQRASDDGEPQGTAGIPVLETIKKENLTNVCVVVTRYFGGILLGAGGLIRAYSSSARAGLLEAKICIMSLYKKIRVVVNYSLLGKVQNAMAEMGNTIINIEYTELVTLYLKVHHEKVERTLKTISELTYGSAQIECLEDYYDVSEVL